MKAAEKGLSPSVQRSGLALTARTNRDPDAFVRPRFSAVAPFMATRTKTLDPLDQRNVSPVVTVTDDKGLTCRVLLTVKLGKPAASSLCSVVSACACCDQLTRAEELVLIKAPLHCSALEVRSEDAKAA